MNRVYIAMIVVCVLWGGWPILAKSAGNQGNVGAFILSGCATIPVIIALISGGGSFPGIKPAIILIISGLMMGVGMIAFNWILSNPQSPISAFIPILNGAAVLMATIGGVWLYSESFDSQKGVGIVLVVIGIILLRPNS